MIYTQVPAIMEFNESMFKNISDSPIIGSIMSTLEGGNLVLAIAMTFLVNLSSGAFLSTTLPGAIPLIGGIGSMAVSGFRGFMIGTIFTFTASVDPTGTIGLGWMLLATGTLILELGAYVFSAAAGINISLSTIFPSRYQVKGRWVAFKEAWKDAGRIYVIVVILLALGAVWEMSGIFILMP